MALDVHHALFKIITDNAVNYKSIIHPDMDTKLHTLDGIKCLIINKHRGEGTMVKRKICYKSEQ